MPQIRLDRPWKAALTRRIAPGMLLALLAGCGYPLANGPKPANVEQPAFNQLWFYAAQQLQCDSKQIHYEQFGEGRHLFKGCGNQIEMIFVKDPSSMSGLYTRAAAANRFSKEIGCDLAATHEEPIDTITRVVDGCGHRITYVFSCNYTCTWVANTHAEEKKPQ
jgi:hypothetical protein